MYKTLTWYTALQLSSLRSLIIGAYHVLYLHIFTLVVNMFGLTMAPGEVGV